MYSLMLSFKTILIRFTSSWTWWRGSCDPRYNPTKSRNLGDQKNKEKKKIQMPQILLHIFTMVHDIIIDIVAYDKMDSFPRK